MSDPAINNKHVTTCGLLTAW